MASIPSERFYNNNWLKIHQNHCFQVKQENINSIITGDSIVVGLTRYTNIWNNLFGNRFINVGISGDRVENVLWRARDIPSLPSLKMSLFLIKILLMISLKVWLPSVQFKNQSTNLNIFICGLLPGDESFSINRLTINEVNDLLKSKCFFKSFHFINQNNGWTPNKAHWIFHYFIKMLYI